MSWWLGSGQNVEAVEYKAGLTSPMGERGRGHGALDPQVGLLKMSLCSPSSSTSLPGFDYFPPY